MHIYGIYKDSNNDLICKGSKRDTDVKNRLLDYMGEARMGYFERTALKHCILPYVKWINKIDKSLARLIKKQREKNQINKIRNDTNVFFFIAE